MNEPPSALGNPHVLSGPFWAELRVFLAVAKARSFNRAAEDLNMSQPTVSRQVRRLQDVLGTQLVMPTQAGIRLTRQGEELARSLHDLDQRLFDIASELSAEARATSGTVHIAATSALAGMFLAPAICAFSDRFPNIRLKHSARFDFASFRDNFVDVMLSIAPARHPEITSRPLGFLHFLPVASRLYIERHGVPTKTNLAEHFFVHCDAYTAEIGLWNAWHALMAHGVVAHSSDDTLCYSMMAKSGLGIGLLANYALCDPDAVPLELGVHVQLPLYLLAPTERLAARPVRLVFDWMAEVYSPSVAWFSPDLRLNLLPRDELTLPPVSLNDGLMPRP